MYLLLLSLLLTPAIVLAQTDVNISNDVSITSTSQFNEATSVSVDFSDEGLSDEDVTVDVEAEALPTTNRFTYWFENARSRVLVALTFNAEQKAAQFRFRLHQLDRKAAACSEIGDKECLERVETNAAALRERAEAFMEKREELRAEHLERFRAWREKREEKQAEFRARVEERKEKREELREERKEKHEEARARHDERMKALRERLEQNKVERQEAFEARQDAREEKQDLRQEQREANREKLIEQRSERVKTNLDATRQRIEVRQNILNRVNEQTQ
jgi:hypothetical protein